MSSCAHCRFIREKVERGRFWLCKGPLGYVCSICSGASVQSQWGRGTVKAAAQLTKQMLDRHERSCAHIDAGKGANNIVDGKVVPPATIFERVWDMMCNGIFSCVAIAGRCCIGRRKALRIKQCFERACRNETQEFLASEGVTLAIHQDASQSWLCVRFTGCNDRLQRTSGLLSFVDLRRWKDGWAENMKDATLNAVIKACTIPGQEPDLNLVAQVLKSVEVFNADAAYDEQLAGQMLRGMQLDGLTYMPSLLPTAKVVHRDKTHAARRLASRGWAADAYLNQARNSEPLG